MRQSEDGAGAWLVAQRAEQRRRFKAVLCTKPRTYSRLKEERKKAEREGTQIPLATQSLADDDDDEDEEAPVLDGFFLMKHCCVEDPADLCSVNISGQNLSEVKEEDFALFDNVAYVNASENCLPFEAFRGFPIIRELEMPINGLRSLKIQPTDYPTLEMLDLSYNNLSQDDVLTLGTLPNLKILHLTGNNFKTLPPDLALPHIDVKSKMRIKRFSKLEILMLDDNRFSDVSIFAALAGLPRLRHLNLEKNEIYYVPQLKSIEGTMIINDEEKATRRLQRSARKSARNSARAARQNKPVSELDALRLEGKSQEGIRPSESKKDVTVKAEKIEEKVEENKEEEPTEKEAGKEVPESGKEGLEGVKEGPEGDKEGPEAGKVEPDAEVKTTPAEETDVNNVLDIEFGNDLGDLSARLEDINADNVTDERLPTADDTAPNTQENPHKLILVEETSQGPIVPPFPELTYMNLAFNMITDEEALLAVAAWPMLVELVINDNPLTTEHSGDPPILKSFLQARLGIRIVRKGSKGIKKPEVKVSPKKSRKVSSIVPKIPKIPVEELLMLEAPKPPSDPKPDSSKTIQGLDLHQQHPLPPISQSSGITRPHSSGIGSRQLQQDIPPAPVYDKLFQSPVPKEENASSGGIPEVASYNRIFSPSEETGGIPTAANYGRLHSPPEDQAPSGVPDPASHGRIHSAPKEEPKQTTSDSPAFFMTQVDEQEEENKVKSQTERKERKADKKKEKEKQKVIDDRYKGYEILLDYEEDPDFIPPKDIEGNVKALKYALNHQLVYRDPTARLDKVAKHVTPYKRWQMPPPVVRKTRQEKIDDVLDNLRNRVTSEEANLGDVLKNKKKSRKLYPEAPDLLVDIQRRYNAVRVNSMKEAKDMKKTMEDLQSLAKGKGVTLNAQ